MSGNTMVRNSKLIRLLVLMLLSLVLTCCEKIGPDDPVFLKSRAFLSAMIEEGVDTNGDGQISYAEAEAVTKLTFIMAVYRFIEKSH